MRAASLPPRARPTIACPAIAIASRQEREQQPELERDLVRGDLGVADPRRDRGCRGERQEQGAGAHGEIRAHCARRPQLGEVGRERLPRSGARCAGRWRGTPARRRSARPPSPTPSPRSRGARRRRARTRATRFTALADERDRQGACACPGDRGGSRYPPARPGRTARRAARCAGRCAAYGEPRAPRRPSRTRSDRSAPRPTAVSVTPSPSASHTPATPCSAAAFGSPAPMRRATVAVVPYARKLKIPNATLRTAPATPSPPSGRVPRCPTIAVSART